MMSNLNLVDSHAHLNDERFKEDLPEVLKRAEAAGVGKVVTVGYDLASSRASVALAQKYLNVWATVGIHPHDAPQCEKDALEQLATWIEGKQAVALGEIGLDYYWNTWDKATQKMAFSAQIELAKSLNVPFVVHNRDAHRDVLEVLGEHAPYRAGFVMHCFSGSAEVALSCLRLGGFISFAGPITFQNARQTLQAARAVPLDRLLVETDCPYLSPHPYRGQRNEPARVALVVEALAGSIGRTVAEVAQATTDNAAMLFARGERAL